MIMLNNKVYWQGGFRIFMIFVILLTLIQQLPLVRESAYEVIRYILYLTLGLMALFSFLKYSHSSRNSSYIFYFLILIYSILIQILVLQTSLEISPLTQILVPFGIVTIAISNKLRMKDFKIIVIIFAIVAVIMGLSNIFYYGNGFEITQNYMLPAKNQIGPIIGYANLVFLCFATSGKKKSILFISFLIIMWFLSFYVLAAIRNRSGLLAIIVINFCYLIYYFFQKFQIKKIIIFLLFITGMIIYGFYSDFFRLLWLSFSLNYDVGDLNSISAGRFSIVVDSIRFIFSNPVLGSLNNDVLFSSTYPHNYILYNIVGFGLILSLPFIIFYFHLVIIAIKQFKYINISFFHTLFSLFLVFALIVSQFEYSYPYGPGVSQLILWFTFGQWLQKGTIYNNE